MIKIAICDNDITMIGNLESLLYEISSKNKIKIAIEGYRNKDDLAKDFISGDEFAIFYINIQAKISDLELAKYILVQNENALIIFLSDDMKYIYDILDDNLALFNFFPRPIEKKRFEKVFLDACKKNENKYEEEYFFYKYYKIDKKVTLQSIYYFKSNGRIIEIHLKNGEIRKYYGKIADVEIALSEKKEHFLRIHQSFLVNFRWIEQFSRSKLILRNKEILSVSGKQKECVLREYKRLMWE